MKQKDRGYQIVYVIITLYYLIFILNWLCLYSFRVISKYWEFQTALFNQPTRNFCEKMALPSLPYGNEIWTDRQWDENE
jgi:hypothetical protein